ncbi:MAG: hypothetical protein IPK28_15070 [Devosia sp.]|nr:hypothetical protein [Devosia sp.]
MGAAPAGPVAAPGGGGSPFLAKFKAEHPDYANVDDRTLADALYRKFYASIPRGEFDAKVGLAPANLSGTVEPRGSTGEVSGNVEMAPGTEFGVPMNVAGGVNRFLLDVTGGLVDRSRNVINWGIAGANALSGQEDLTTNMIESAVGDSNSIASAMQAVGMRDPRTIKPVTLAERIAAGAGEGIGATLAPKCCFRRPRAAGRLRLGLWKPSPRSLGSGSSVGGMARNAVAGGMAGGGSVAAMEAAPEPWKPMAGVAGGLAGALAGAGLGELPGLAVSAGKATGNMLRSPYPGRA